jgi:DNA-binding CsgD family transcriptional regulator
MTSGVYQRTMRTHEEKMASVRDRLWALSIPEPNSGCWIFTGYLGRGGYGTFAIDKRVRMGAHRASYWAHKGEISGKDILHTCDVPWCINPDHLFAGTHAENMADMVAKGRAHRKPGSAHYFAKLTEDDVKAIRASGLRGAEIARRYGISRSTAYSVLLRNTWTHI